MYSLPQFTRKKLHDTSTANNPPLPISNNNNQHLIRRRVGGRFVVVLLFQYFKVRCPIASVSRSPLVKKRIWIYAWQFWMSRLKTLRLRSDAKSAPCSLPRVEL